MKKLFTLLLVSLFLFQSPIVKANETNSYSIVKHHNPYIIKSLKAEDSDEGIKGKIIVSAGVGFNVFGTILEARYLLSSYYDFEGNMDGHTQTPMINVMADYGFARKFSVGVAFGYQTAKVKFRDVYAYGDSQHDTWTRIHLAVRGDYHIVAKENVGLYTGLKLGYNLYTVKTTLREPNYLSNLDVYPQPLSIQAHFGFSYYFNGMIGFNTEVGLGYGGPYLFAVGLTVKI
jgi:hypothetical protein